MDLQRRLSSNECDELESVMEAADPSRTGLMQGSLTRLHGFLTSVISGPLVQPSEWLSVVFAETGTWRTKAEADRGYSLVMRFNNEVASDLIEGRFGIMVDCVGEEPDAVEYADDWCLGYWAGTELRRDQWDAALEDDTLATLVRPIIALADLDDAGTFSHDRDPERYRRMLEVLPEFAVRIYDWWRQHDSALPHEPVRRASPKVSPNASCPCGSGKKYKKCCGAP